MTDLVENLLEGGAQPKIDTTLFVSEERQRELVFGATLPYCGKDDVAQAIREAIEETVRTVQRHSSRAAIRAVEADRAATHRHKKCGSEYVLLGIGKMQSEDWIDETRDTFDDSVDMRDVAIYRSVDNGHLWVRPREEFEDGRFEALPLSDGESE